MLSDASARRFYAEYVSLSAALRISQGTPVLNLSSPAPQFSTLESNSTAGPKSKGVESMEDLARRYVGVGNVIGARVYFMVLPATAG